jgi:hypothetical protein
MSKPHQVRVAIVTTLRNAGPALDSFIAYHRAIGFAHLFLFFDDPDDPDLRRAGAMPDVTAIPVDSALREEWRKLRGYGRFGAFVDSEVMSRQLLNVELAMDLARASGHEWLLNIDADELFFSPRETATQHFEALTATAFETIQYLNYEAVPVRDEVRDFFHEVDLFKPPLGPARSHLGAALLHAEETVPQLKPFFHFYSNGKSAVRLTGELLEPFGVHEFRRIAGNTKVASSAAQFILHYACCGFESFWTKYVTLGRFPDKWWAQYDIAASIGTFHLEARDVVLTGDRDRARAFYRNRIAIADSDLAEQLTRSRILARLVQPRQIIEAARGI